MAPMANEIRFEGDEADKLLKRRNVYFTALIQQLFDMVKNKAVIMRDSDSLVKYLDLWQIFDLVHIDSIINREHYEATSLLHRSTHKLQSLAIVMGF
ncbi:hypothetical protein GGI19_004145 [Coemansia pectinata]|uniref:Uncharacterized protein n=1 Tax=Coemansia pectinata TaxID=1052879 RepID=A0A9W8LAL2_9FUNG|nr:hypothetical protein GGI19_004145 [Coemansia pectinata]